MRQQRHNLVPSWRLIAGTAATALIASLSLAFSKPAAMDIDGQRVLSDVAPITVGGVAYVPLRAVSDASGAITAYDPATGSLVVRRGTETLSMRIGARRALLDGHHVRLAHAPFAVHGHAMVDGRDIAPILAAAVTYNARTDRVDVRTPGGIVAGAPDSP